MNPAEIILLGLALVASVACFARYRAVTAKQRENRRRQRLGLKNAERELELVVPAEVCVICQLPVVPENDLFDKATNSWWHRSCWRQSVK